MDTTVVVTGGNSGVGLGCVESLHARGYTVVLACRDAARAEPIARRLGSRAVVLPLDLSSLASVEAAADAFETLSLPPLGALVLNAGIMSVSDLRATADGYELNFGTNHLGHFHLTRRLLPRLREGGRVVAVSSSGHDPKTMAGRSGPPRWIGADALSRPTAEGAGRIAPMSRYTTSKLCNVLFAYELHRRLEAEGRRVMVNAFDPGVVLGTTLGRDLGALNRFIASQPWLVRLLGGRLVTPSEAGRHLAELAIDDRFGGVSARYFEGPREVRSSDASYDVALQRELWDVSAALVAEALRGAPSKAA